MPDAKITDATPITGANVADGDLFRIIDISAGTSGSKSITRAELKAALGLPSHELSIRRDTNQSITTATVTAITWDAEESDPQGIFTASADFVTIPTGVTQCRAWATNINFAANATGERLVMIEEMTTTPTRVKVLAIEEQIHNGSSAWYGACSFGWKPVTAANRIYTRVFQTSGGSLNLVSASDVRPHLTVEFR
jgi:hypothetical protein